MKYISGNKTVTHLRVRFWISDNYSFESDFKEWYNKLLDETLIIRDEYKNALIAENLKEVAIANADLKKIYEQLEKSERFWIWHETWWYFFTNIYPFVWDTLKLWTLANPLDSEMNTSASSFTIKPDAIDSFNLKHRIRAFYEFHDTKEASKMISILAKSNGKNYLSWAVLPLNWHKHPGRLYHPSMMDMNSEDWAQDIFSNNPNLNMMFWWIAVKSDDIKKDAKNFQWCVILKKEVYGGKNDYMLNFWKVKRNQDNKYNLNNLIRLKIKVQ